MAGTPGVPQNAQIQAWRSNLYGKAHPAIVNSINLIFDAIQDHDTAIVGVNQKVEALTPSTPGPVTPVTPTPSTPSGTVFGGVNNQTGTAYTLALSDLGAIVTLDNAAAVAVALNSSLPAPFVCFIENLGVGLVTLTPTTGNVNGVAAITLGTNQSCFAVLSGVGWFCATSPQAVLTLAFVAHQFVVSYDATTGVLATAQPDFTDLSGTATAGQVPSLSALTGQITLAQLPASGLTVTITTAALTTLGTQGSMTFTNGILTAQTPAT